MDITIRLPFGRKKLLLILAVISVLAVLAIIFWPRQTQSQTEYEYLTQQISNIESYTATVKQENAREPSQAMLLNNIESYQNALLEGLATCEQIEIRINKADKESLKPYEDAITKTELFCRDYEDVVDYARKVSKATRQFIAYPDSLLLESQQGLNDLKEILGYTRSDLEKLKSYPLQDPALEEMITSINGLQKQTDKAISDGSPQKTAALVTNVEKQKNDLMTSRNYFWNNTIRVNAMDRSIDRLQKIFEESRPESS